MKLTPIEIYKIHPDLGDVADRLEESYTKANQGNKNLKEAGNPTGKGTNPHTPEHAVISHFLKGGRWEQSPCTLKPGKEFFERDLVRILETRKPDAIRVKIYKGITNKSQELYSNDFQFSYDDEKQQEEANELGVLLEKKFDEKLEQFKKNPDANNLQIEILRREFHSQLIEQQHKAELKELQLQHQNEINSLQNAIRGRDEYIRELEDDLELNEGELGSLKAESEKEKSTPFGEIVLSRVLMQAGENLLKHNPKILKIGLGLSDTEIKKIFEKDTKELGAAKPEDNSGFSESAGDDLAGLDEKHAQGIKDLIAFFKQIKIEEFKKVYTIDCLLQDAESGFLNNELADKTLAFINEHKTPTN